jgi:SAM-dependent methyltransferase
MRDAASALSGLLRILLPLLDILDGRVEDGELPAWCVRRGWDAFLLALDDAELRRCEEEGLGERAQRIPGAPADLIALAREAAAATALSALEGAGPPTLLPMRAVSARKGSQLPALLGAVEAMARRAARIVDVGAGSGHFTLLAAERFEREAVGIERDAARVAASKARAAERGAGAARFVAADACREALVLAEGDLAVGLHACGALGDRLILAAAAAGCDVALVSCCLQKIEGAERAPLSRVAAGLSLRRETLGLTNLAPGPEGVEASLDATLAAREARQALRLLLRERGVETAPGEEMRGINRRRAHAGLAAIAAPALARRGLPAAREPEIRRCEEEARRRHARTRRLSLPRSMLARPLEIAVVLDRAAALEESGSFSTRVCTLFERAVTPRNVALFASRAPGRLPG